MLAKLYADLAKAEKAIEHAKKVVELEPEDTFSYTALSVIYQRCGKIPEAEHAKAMAWQKQMGLLIDVADGLRSEPPEPSMSQSI